MPTDPLEHSLTSAQMRHAPEGDQRNSAIGPYEVLDLLGSGSFGIVYRVTRVPGETLALKLLITTDAEDTLRFEREIELARRLEHPGLVPIVDAGRQAQFPYYVMEYCPGETLTQRLTRGPLDPDDAIQLVLDLARTTAEINAGGVVHRDLKPSNVIVGPNGRPRITDFGLAHDARAAERLTRTGDRMGTPAYMAPELFEDAKRADQRVDVYALGVILYECLTGARPFQADDLAQFCRAARPKRPLPLAPVAAPRPPPPARSDLPARDVPPPRRSPHDRRHARRRAGAVSGGAAGEGHRACPPPRPHRCEPPGRRDPGRDRDPPGALRSAGLGDGAGDRRASGPKSIPVAGARRRDARTCVQARPGDRPRHPEARARRRPGAGPGRGPPPPLRDRPGAGARRPRPRTGRDRRRALGPVHPRTRAGAPGPQPRRRTRSASPRAARPVVSGPRPAPHGAGARRPPPPARVDRTGRHRHPGPGPPGRHPGPAARPKGPPVRPPARPHPDPGAGLPRGRRPARQAPQRGPAARHRSPRARTERPRGALVDDHRPPGRATLEGCDPIPRPVAPTPPPSGRRPPRGPLPARADVAPSAPLPGGDPVPRSSAGGQARRPRDADPARLPPPEPPRPDPRRRRFPRRRPPLGLPTVPSRPRPSLSQPADPGRDLASGPHRPPPARHDHPQPRGDRAREASRRRDPRLGPRARDQAVDRGRTWRPLAGAGPRLEGGPGGAPQRPRRCAAVPRRPDRPRPRQPGRQGRDPRARAHQDPPPTTRPVPHRGGGRPPTPEAAGGEARLAAARSPRPPGPDGARAGALLALPNKADVLEALERAAKGSPQHIPTLASLVVARTLAGDPLHAIALCDRLRQQGEVTVTLVAARLQALTPFLKHHRLWPWLRQDAERALRLAPSSRALRTVVRWALESSPVPEHRAWLTKVAPVEPRRD